MRRVKFGTAILLFFGLLCTNCGDPSDIPQDVDGSMEVTSTIITVGGDFAGNGVITRVELPSHRVTTNVVAGVVGGDPVLRSFGDVLVIIDRFGGDTVTLLNKDLTLIGQVSTGGGSNPQDAAIIGDVLYVVLYGDSDVIRFDLRDLGAGVQGRIDLSELDPDGIPNCASIHVVSTTLYVSCQLLDGAFEPTGVGKIAVIDVATNLVETILELHGSNPLSFLDETASGDLLVSTVLNPASFDPQAVGSGCIEQISTGKPARVLPCLVSNADLDGYASDVAIFGESVFFVKSISFGTATLHEFTRGTQTQLTLPGLGANLAGIVTCPTGELVVADNTVGARGLRVYKDGSGGELLDVGWPTVAFPTNGTICW